MKPVLAIIALALVATALFSHRVQNPAHTAAIQAKAPHKAPVHEQEASGEVTLTVAINPKF